MERTFKGSGCYRRKERVLHRTVFERSGLQNDRCSPGNQCGDLSVLANTRNDSTHVTILSSRPDIESIASHAAVHLLALRIDAFRFQHVRLLLLRKDRFDDVRWSAELFGILPISWCTRQLRITHRKKFGISSDDDAITRCVRGNIVLSVYSSIQKPQHGIRIDLSSRCKFSCRDHDNARDVC